MKRILWCSGAAAVLLGASPALAAQDIVQRAEQLADTYERVRAGEQSRDKLPRNVANAAAEIGGGLEVHLRENPEDVRALIAAARVEHVRVLESVLSWSPRAGEGPPDNRPVAAHELLERALALEPDNAEAHYWQARLYGTRHPGNRDGVLVREPEDVSQAIAHARRAVELAPTELHYREALAQYLIDDQQFDAAMALMRDAADGTHPIYLILLDMSRVPLPPNAAYSARESRSLAEFLINRGRFANHAFLRTRAYFFLSPIEEVDRFYRDSVPKVRVFEAGRGGSSRAVYFHIVGDRLAPSDEEVNGYPPDRISVAIHEVPAEDDVARQRYGIDREGPFCVIFVINTRAVR